MILSFFEVTVPPVEPVFSFSFIVDLLEQPDYHHHHFPFLPPSPFLVCACLRNNDKFHSSDKFSTTMDGCNDEDDKKSTGFFSGKKSRFDEESLSPHSLPQLSRIWGPFWWRRRVLFQSIFTTSYIFLYVWCWQKSIQWCGHCGCWCQDYPMITIIPFSLFSPFWFTTKWQWSSPSPDRYPIPNTQYPIPNIPEIDLREKRRNDDDNYDMWSWMMGFLTPFHIFRTHKSVHLV